MNRTYFAGIIEILVSLIALSYTSITPVNAQPSMALVPASEPVILDVDNNLLCIDRTCDVTVYQRVFIRSTLTSNFHPESFVYIVQIKDDEDVTVSLSWVQSKLGKDESGSFSQSWVPDRVERYRVETFVWSSLENPLPLSPFRSLEVSASQNVPSNVKCDGKLVPQIDYKNNTIPVLLMQPNSAATVCVTYQFLHDWATYPYKSVYPKGIVPFSLAISGNDKFRVVAIPNQLNVSGATNGSKFTITYKIYAMPNSKGFYDQAVPQPICGSYPMAVGYAATQVKASDFRFLSIGVPCALSFDMVDSVQISGMDYTQIVFHPP